MKVCWLHNYPDRTMGMFMWDVWDALLLAPDISLEERAMPVVRGRRDVVSLLRQKRYICPEANLLHAQYGSIVGYLARGTGRPYLLTLRGSDIYPHPGDIVQRLGGWVRRCLSYVAARRARAIVVMSQAMYRRVRRWPGIKGQSVHILVDPVSRLFWPIEDQRLASRMQEQPLTVTVASRLENNPIKRLELVQQAQMLCRGVGLRIDLQQMIALDRQAVRDAIAKSDVLALASTHEGWPNVVKEALLLGKGFVATDVSDLSVVAAKFPSCKICAPTAVDFAFAMIDLIAAKACVATAKAEELVGFHPDVAALKHRILYQAYGPRL